MQAENKEPASSVTQTEIFKHINQFDEEPDWCLPQKFWQRATVISGYTVYPLGKIVHAPMRQCHTTSIRVVDNGTEIGEALVYCTGYARYNDVWSRHSWVLHDKDKILLETTPNDYDEYFGVSLTEKEFGELKEIMDYKE